MLNSTRFLGNGFVPGLKVAAFKQADKLFFIQYEPATHHCHLSKVEDRQKFSNCHKKAIELGYKPTRYTAGKYGGVYVYLDETTMNALTQKEFNNLSN